jgi:DUF1365 family protein
MHARRAPVENVFRYGVCMFLLDLDELDELERRLALFSVDRPNVVTLRSRDHLGDPARSLKQNVVEWVSGRGIDLEGGRVLALTNLGVLGYVFNPVTFFWCYRGSGDLACIVAEVNNTYGESHPYLLSPAEELDAAGRRRAWATDKRLHVSPFFSLDQGYTWIFSEPGAQVHARIDVREKGARPFHATLTARRRELTNRSLAGALVRYPLMPLQVIGLIHWQALRLRLRGVNYLPKPPFVPGEGSVNVRTGAVGGRDLGPAADGAPAGSE